MTVSISPTTDTLDLVARNVEFSFTVSASGDDGESFTSVNATKNFDDDNVVITSGISSVTISGIYVNGFIDIGRYVRRGSSDKLQTPVEVIGIDNIPQNQDLYDYSQDLTAFITRDYTITVNGSKDGSPFTSTFNLEQEVGNDWSTGTAFCGSYYS